MTTGGTYQERVSGPKSLARFIVVMMSGVITGAMVFTLIPLLFGVTNASLINMMMGVGVFVGMVFGLELIFRIELDEGFLINDEFFY